MKRMRKHAAAIALPASVLAVLYMAPRATVGGSEVSESAAAFGQAVLSAEFVFDTLPVPSVHASTIVELQDVILVAWFGGSHEGANDVGIWAARFVAGTWTPAIEVALGVAPDGSRLPCWNPVLFVPPDGSLRLYYKVGPSPQRWWGMMLTSRDGGRSWSAPERLPDGVLGPIKNKPVTLPDGTIISPSSTESVADPSVWRIHFERSTDGGRSWTTAPPPAQRIDAIQPSVLVHGDGRLQALGRTRSGRVFETWSTDGGVHWSELALTVLPNPNSGLDAVTLRDGRHLLVYNHTTSGRSPLNVAVSDDGSLWEAALVLESEPGEFSYPSVIQASDGLVHITYTWRRQRIRHVVIDPELLETVPMPAGQWPEVVR
jgi:predicted neuraminidase